MQATQPSWLPENNVLLSYCQTLPPLFAPSLAHRINDHPPRASSTYLLTAIRRSASIHPFAEYSPCRAAHSTRSLAKAEAFSPPLLSTVEIPSSWNPPLLQFETGPCRRRDYNDESSGPAQRARQAYRAIASKGASMASFLTATKTLRPRTLYGVASPEIVSRKDHTMENQCGCMTRYRPSTTLVYRMQLSTSTKTSRWAHCIVFGKSLKAKRFSSTTWERTPSEPANLVARRFATPGSSNANVQHARCQKARKSRSSPGKRDSGLILATSGEDCSSARGRRSELD